MYKQQKEILSAEIIGNQRIGEDIYKLSLGGGRLEKVFREAKAGQFINVYLKDASMILPRPISLCLLEEKSITLVYRREGAGTKQLSSYRAGECISISSPLGNGYMLHDSYEGESAVVVGGGIGIPPMVELAKELEKRGAKVIGAFGYKDASFLTEEAGRYCSSLYLSSDTGAVGMKGNVVELLQEEAIGADHYFACGPKIMLKALASYCEKKGKPLQVSMEERMGCGYGACVGCTCKTMEEKDGKLEIAKKSVCKDGPVFWAKELIWE